ncbi:HD domain-containing protein [Candidatus Clostridium radicumherbarum]|uniref:HD domain-containing protein n=1 Tax=Candidatus Clostridium radicumherbarum TaxID=3381662 RepID=A0ABW8TWA4_9CLOT
MNNLALQTAWQAHSHQKRKGTEIPYVIHPIEVAIILIENGAEEDLITAGLLHDTLEDTNITKEYITQNFGRHVLNLVVGASEPYKLETNTRLSIEEEIDSWKVRKTHTINFIAMAPLEIKLLTCADKLSNIRSMVKDYNLIGNELWKKFNAGAGDQKWYYEELIKSLCELSEYKLYKEFTSLVKELFSSEEVLDFIRH